MAAYRRLTQRERAGAESDLEYLTVVPVNGETCGLTRRMARRPETVLS